MTAVALPERFRPYAWAPSSAEIAARHGLHPEQILRFDQNTPPVPAVPQVPLAESFARLNEYPDGTYAELKQAAAAYCGVGTDQIVVGAGADELIGLCARTYLAPGRFAAIEPPTYALYRIVAELEGASVRADTEGAALIWVCNPNNPTGDLRDPAEIAALARAHPDAVVVVDEAYFEYAGVTCVPLLAELPNVIVLRTLSKAFALAALRVGWAVAAPDVAAELERRRPPASISAPAARLGAAALREPRLDVEETIAERKRVREALTVAGHDAPASHGNFVFVRDPSLGPRLEAQGLVVRETGGGIRITAAPAARERRPPRRPRRGGATFAGSRRARRPHEHRDGAACLARARRGRTCPRRDRHRLPRPPADPARLPGRFDLELVGSGDLDVDEHHTIEDVLAALGDALDEALGERDGITRYGDATVPMDEATRVAASTWSAGRTRRSGSIDRGAHRDAAAARARAFRDAGARDRARDGLRERRPPRRRGRVQGRRPRARHSVRTQRDGRRLDEGARVRIVLADYGAGNLRSVVSALARAGADPVVTADPADVREARLVVIAGVGNAASAGAGLEPSPTRSESGSRWPAAARDLRRPPAPVRAERRGRCGAGPAPRSGSATPGDDGPAHGLEHARRARPTALLEGLDGADVYFAHSYAAVPGGRRRDRGCRARRHDRGGGRVGPLAGRSSTRSGAAAAGARLLENALRWSRSV